MAARRKPGPAEVDLVSDLRTLRLADSGVLVRLALALARRVDSGEFTASDAQQLRLTWAAIREESRPALAVVPDEAQAAADGTPGPPPLTALERARQAREERERDGGAR